MEPYIDESSKVSQLDLYEDLLANENSTASRCVTVKEVIAQKDDVVLQNKELTKQLDAALCQLQKLTEEHNILQRNFASLLETAKVELERKNKLIAVLTQKQKSIQKESSFCLKEDSQRHQKRGSRERGSLQKDMTKESFTGRSYRQSADISKHEPNSRKRPLESRSEVECKIPKKSLGNLKGKRFNIDDNRSESKSPNRNSRERSISTNKTDTVKSTNIYKSNLARVAKESVISSLISTKEVGFSEVNKTTSIKKSKMMKEVNTCKTKHFESSLPDHRLHEIEICHKLAPQTNNRKDITKPVDKSMTAISSTVSSKCPEKSSTTRNSPIRTEKESTKKEKTTSKFNKTSLSLSGSRSSVDKIGAVKNVPTKNTTDEKSNSDALKLSSSSNCLKISEKTPESGKELLSTNMKSSIPNKSGEFKKSEEKSTSDVNTLSSSLKSLKKSSEAQEKSTECTNNGKNNSNVRKLSRTSSLRKSEKLSQPETKSTAKTEKERTLNITHVGGKTAESRNYAENNSNVRKLSQSLNLGKSDKSPELGTKMATSSTEKEITLNKTQESVGRKTSESRYYAENNSNVRKLSQSLNLGKSDKSPELRTKMATSSTENVKRILNEAVGVKPAENTNTDSNKCNDQKVLRSPSLRNTDKSTDSKSKQKTSRTKNERKSSESYKPPSSSSLENVVEIEETKTSSKRKKKKTSSELHRLSVSLSPLRNTHETQVSGTKTVNEIKKTKTTPKLRNLSISLGSARKSIETHDSDKKTATETKKNNKSLHKLPPKTKSSVKEGASVPSKSKNTTDCSVGKKTNDVEHVSSKPKTAAITGPILAQKTDQCTLHKSTPVSLPCEKISVGVVAADNFIPNQHETENMDTTGNGSSDEGPIPRDHNSETTTKIKVPSLLKEDSNLNQKKDCPVSPAKKAPEVLKLPTKQREELYTDIATSEVSKKYVNPIAKKNVVFTETEKENSTDTTSVPNMSTQNHSLGFMYGYRNASLQCLLHISTKLLASFKTEKAPVPKARDLWMLSLDNCQKRRKFNNQWQSERISEKENVIVTNANTEHALPSAG
ncbi:uncharacterized protein LOC100180330 [Ciona intestinalis]